jgi:uncharacterized lipoprotein YmbA
VLWGCGASAQSRFYTLDPSSMPDRAPPVQTTVLVELVSVPAAVEQPQLVIHVTPNRVEVEEFDRWDAPLADGIARAIAGGLSGLLATPNVATLPLADFNSAYAVTITPGPLHATPWEPIPCTPSGFSRVFARSCLTMGEAFSPRSHATALQVGL